MKKLLQISILALLAVTYLMIGLSYAATVEAESCSQAHVQTAVDTANRGDTVTIPAGSCTWSTSTAWETDYVYRAVLVTKAIKIVGAGIDTTNITTNLPTPSGTYKGYFAILYVPETPASDANEEFSITGITFDDVHTTSIHAGAIGIFNRSTTALNKIKIFGNKFNNCYGGESTATDYTATIYTEGTIYGVVYSNTFSGLPYFKHHGYPRSNGGLSTWNSITWTPGSTKAMYYEDNTILKNTDGSSPHTYWSSGWGAAYVVRYNDITVSYDQADLWNMHSIQRGGTYDDPTWYNYATMGLEAYGNSITSGGEVYPWNQGGGRLMAFYNYVNNTAGSTVKSLVSDVMSDSYAPTSNTCTDSLFSGTGQPVTACTTDHERQRVTKTYIWKNYKSTTAGLISFTKLSSTTWTLWEGNKLSENIHYWKDNANCSATAGCSSGIGCGSSAPTGNCSTGAAYFKTAKSCTTLTDYIGAEPTTPFTSDDVLYRCGPANVWSAYYSPLAYPHPLRATDPDPPADTDAPAMSNPCAGSGTCTYPIIQIACDDLDDTEDILLGITATDAAQATTVCYYDLETRADYAAMAADGHELTASGTSYTATAAGLACASSHTFWYACSDGTNETAVSNTSFVIAGRGDDTQAVITNASTTQQACAVIQKIQISTDKPSTCKWSLTDEAYADMDYTFSVTGGETGHVAHSTDVSQNCSESVTRYIRCSTTQGVANTSSTAVTITTDAGKTVSIGAGSLTIGIGTGSNSIGIIQ